MMLLPVILSAGELRLDVERLSTKDGLSHNTVWDIHQDDQGFLWLATGSELNRYDGYTFKAYRHDSDDPSSFPTGSARVLFEDRQGNLWFGTGNQGLTRLDALEERFEHSLHDPKDPKSLPDNRVRSLVEDHDGNLWIGTLGGLIQRRGNGEFTLHRHRADDPDSLINNSIWSLLVDRHGGLWVGTPQGLDRYDAEGERFIHVRQSATESWRPEHNRISSLLEDSQGRILIGSQDGLLRYDFDRDVIGTLVETNETFSKLGQVNVLFESLAGEIWIGTKEGLARLSEGENAGQQARLLKARHDPDDPYSLGADEILDIHEDASGILWVATRGGGLNKINPRRQQFTALRGRPGRVSAAGGNLLSGSQVWAVADDPTGLLWVGTYDGGLNALDRTRGTVTTYRANADEVGSLPSDKVSSLLVDHEGELWVGTLGGGIGKLDRQAQRFTYYRHDAEDPNSLVFDVTMSLIEDRKHNVWVGTIRGLQRFDRQSQTFTTFTHDPEDPFSLSSDSVYSLTEDHSGDIWVVTGDGLNRLDVSLETSRFTRYLHEPDNANSLSSSEVTSFYEDENGMLWVGTAGGFNRLDRSNGTVRRYWRKDGLPGDHVVAMLPGTGNELWLSTDRGLSRFDRQTETFRNYDVGDGIHSNTFYIDCSYRSAAGELFFCGSGGLTSFFPDQITEDPHAPAVVLTDFLLLNQSVALRHRNPSSPLLHSISRTDELVLDHRHKVVGLEFAALHYANPDKNQYAYRLEGFDDHWIETDAGKRFAHYTNLSQGNYVFRVKASNQHGVWNEMGASLRIQVLPPPWKTWWAWSLYTLALLTALASYVIWQRKRLRRERAINDRLRQVDRLKDEFLANTSHELRTPLYGITGLAESLVDGASGRLPKAAQANLAMISASARRLSSLVGDLLDFSKLRHQGLELVLRPVDLYALTDVVFAVAKVLAEDKSLRLVNAIDPSLPSALADEDRVHQILLNLVSNGIKFTEKGSVAVSMQETGEELLVQVTDTGIGIPSNKLERVFESFEQADASIVREYGGTGLGLAISRQLVELHGGRIWATSELGEGTVFHFTLPRAQPKKPVVERPSKEPSVVETGTFQVVSPSELVEKRDHPAILIVDDEPVVRQVLMNHLVAGEYRLRQASSGAGALQVLESEPIDLVLLDVMMPRMSGYEVCRTIRERHPREELPVVFLSAKAQDSDRTAGLSEGANDYLHKPISKGELLLRVRAHLDVLDAHRRQQEKVKVLQGMLPICCQCKRIRDDEGYWSEIETYISQRSEAEFSHGICVECASELYPDIEFSSTQTSTEGP